ncbi:MAG: PD40 domain-containing protein [Anaerolineae bacterium]|nr:PD40 domain-containing protein [Anaerolineae bacterium]
MQIFSCKRLFVAALALFVIVLVLACGPVAGATKVLPTVTPHVVGGTAAPAGTDAPVQPTNVPPTEAPAPIATESPPEPTAGPTALPAATHTPLPTATPGPTIVRVYASREAVGATEIFVEYSDGTVVNVTNHPAEDGYPDLSPNGTRIVFASTRGGGPAHIYVMNVDGSDVVQLTDAPSGDTLPVWSPDGIKIAFQSLRDGNYEIYVMNADGSGQTNLTNHPGKDLEPSWSPDGTQIYFKTDRDGNMYDDYVMNADGSGQAPKP